MNLKIVRLMLRVTLITNLLWAISPTSVFAGGGVGNGAPESCTEAALDAALADGGIITFDCGAAPHIIVVSSLKLIGNNTTIDGGGRIALSGGNTTRVFIVASGVTLTLNNLTIQNAFNNSGGGGAILNRGTLNINHGKFLNNKATGDGGAIVSDGTLNISNSKFLNNEVASNFSGGAIMTVGPLNITGSEFANNIAGNGGAIYPRFAAAVTSITNSSFHDNQVINTTNGWGGTILTWDGSRVTIEGSDNYSNTAQFGGGLYNTTNSSLSLNGSTLRGNSANLSGGGLFNDGTATLTGAILSGNTAGLNGGGLYNSFGTATLTGVIFSGNLAGGSGGGLHNLSGTVSLTNSTLRDNSAGNGGGLRNIGTTTLTGVTLSGNSADNEGGRLYNQGSATLAGVTFSGNSAGNYGGGLYNYDHYVSTATLTHVTFSGNTAGLSGGGIRTSGRVTVRASIVANSPSGGNCSADPVTNNGSNLSTDASCSGFNQVANVMLGPLADNGGPTKTHMPQLGSPAIDFVATGCPPPATDQRGASRPTDGDGGGAACDAGAVEYGAAVSVVYLPLVIK